MCPPEHFAVEYAINPWMEPGAPVDVELAVKQWTRLRETLQGLGHTVHVLPAQPALPDMVYAANGAFSVEGVVYGARFRYPQRSAEADRHRAFYEAIHDAGGGWRFVAPTAVNEGEGDFAYLPGLHGGLVLAGYGFRTEPAAHLEAQEVLERPVLSLQLVDPRFYHLDTALAVLDETTIAWFPEAFSPASRGVLADRYPDAVTATAADAAVLGLNAVSDGRHVVLPAEATDLAAALAERGFVPVPIEMSELLKGGGGPKCCTLEVRP